jgi:hypothetical protein
LPYPKGESKRYDAGGIVKTQQLLFAWHTKRLWES